MSDKKIMENLRCSFSYQHCFEEAMRPLRPYIDKFVREIFGFEERKDEDEKKD